MLIHISKLVPRGEVFASSVAVDGLVLNHQAINSHKTDSVAILPHNLIENFITSSCFTNFGQQWFK